jgi:transcriptional regulator
MYIPKRFLQDDITKLKGMMAAHSFATFITQNESKIEANHMPLILNKSSQRVVLQGHIAKANPLWKSLKDKSEVLIIFNGPNCYISPNYYPTKKENGKVVPTWNYVSVHVKGIVSFIHDEQWILTMLNNLTDHYEANQPIPWSVNDAPQAYIDKMLSAIVGLEIEIVSITGKWKVSQDKTEVNQEGIIKGLSHEANSNAQNIATLVKEYLK